MRGPPAARDAASSRATGRIGAACAILLAFCLAGTPLMGQTNRPADLEEVRRLYYAAVQSADSIDPAFEAISRARERSGASSTLRAYEGAVTTLRAKHGFWPHVRLRHLVAGFTVLDAVVARDPSNAEARYLRLMSGFYLPAILGRREEVAEDFDALARLLPDERGRYPDELYRAITRFVLRHGDPSPHQAEALRGILVEDDED